MLKKQLYIVYILSLFLPILALGSFLLYNNYVMLYEHHEEMLSSDNLRVRSIVFEVTTSITNICDVISEDEALHELIRTDVLSLDEQRKLNHSFTLLGDIYNRQTNISQITLYVTNPSMQSLEHVRYVDDELKEWFEEQSAVEGYYWSTLSDVNNKDILYHELQLSHKLNVTGTDHEALLVITVSNNYLKNRIDNNQLDVDLSVIEDPIFYSTWGNAGNNIDFMAYEEDDFFSYSGVSSYIDEPAMMEVSAIRPYKSKDSIYIFSKNGLALWETRRIVLINALIVMMSLVIPMVIIIKFTGQFTRRVDTLRTEMHRVTGGDYNIIENFKGNDELVDLFHDLQTMIHSIKERDKTIFDSRIKEQKLINHQQKMEMELLSSKINPHFLYNTLESIRMKAFSNDDYEVSKAVKLLGKYMRYNLESTGEPTSLQSELAYIKTYLDIQSLRFSGRIEAEIIIDDRIETESVVLLPLLIQPIVENSYVHAHEETIDGGYIRIEVRRIKEMIRIIVSDNGIGMSENKIDDLTHLMTVNEVQDRSHIGLHNIHQRLQLFYGSEYGVTIDSVEGEGTAIWFEIPADENGKEE